MVTAVRSLVVEGPPVPPLHARPILVSLAAIVLFGVALDQFGLIAAIAALVIVGAYASSESRLVPTLGLAAALIIFSAAIFVRLLGLPIPLWPGE
jgi:uncharacterized membrane protein YedE/YeeE